MLDQITLLAGDREFEISLQHDSARSFGYEVRERVDGRLMLRHDLESHRSQVHSYRRPSGALAAGVRRPAHALANEPEVPSAH